jgi:hypothetical protein
VRIQGDGAVELTLGGAGGQVQRRSEFVGGVGA